MLATYTVRGVDLGTVDVPADHLGRPRSWAWFCPKCGDVWARRAIPGRPYHVWAALCARHTPPYPEACPGTLFLPLEPIHNTSLPSAAYAREFDLHARATASPDLTLEPQP